MISRTKTANRTANLLSRRKKLTTTSQKTMPPARWFIILFIMIFTLILANADQQPTKNQCPLPGNLGKGWTLLGPSKCYKISSNVKNYSGAVTRCRDISSQLVEVESDHLADGVKATLDSLSGLIPAVNKSDIIRSYYVNLSPELQEQFQRLKKNGFYNESSHVDEDGGAPESGIWLPRGDPDVIKHTVDLDQHKDGIGFALIYSHAAGRWGLWPVPATRRFYFICELNINQESQNSRQDRPQMLSPNTKPVDSRRNVDLETQPSSSSANHYYSITNEQQQPSQQNHDKGATSTTTTTTPAPEPSSLLFRELPQDSLVVFGSTAEMRCSALDSESTLTWTFNNRSLISSNRIKSFPNGILRIEHVRNSDSGNYTCSINSGGSIESRTARLEIIQRPMAPEYVSAELLDKLSTSVRIKWTPGFDGKSPIIKYSAEMRTVENDNYDDMSFPQHTWEMAKANISADSVSVIITDLKPAKKYIFRVKAVNRVGTSDPSPPTRPSIEIPVQPPSSPPENFMGSAKNSTSIALSWQPPPADSQNGVIKGYKVRHKLANYASDTVWYTTDVPDAAHLSYVLDDLIVWQSYEIQIAAENDKGSGPFSSSIIVRTKEGKPDRPPRFVHSTATGPTSIKVEWRSPPPQNINGQNQGYRIQIWPDAHQSKLVKEVLVPHNSASPDQVTTIDGLLPYTDYYVTVKCYTNAGDGPANEEPFKVRTNEDFPEAVTTLEFADVIDKSLRLVWKPPQRVNGELDHYTVEYSESSHSDKKILKQFPAGTTETIITGLSPQTPYTFKIIPHNRIGPGPGKTSSTTTSVPPVLPEPPSNLVVTSISPRSVTIRFDPGFDGNAHIEKWIVEAMLMSRGDSPNSFRHIYTSTNHTQGNTVVVHNLLPFTNYQLRLIPTNVVGSSRYPSEPTKTFQTAQTKPEEAPRDLTIEDIKKNSITAHWLPLSNYLWLGNPKGYNLTWSESNNSTVQYFFINDTRADSCVIRDLEEFTDYVFRIYAVNEAGSSPASDTVSITTLEDVPTSGPANLTAHALSPSTVNVEWNSIPKRHRNGNILGYKIQYQVADKPDAPLQQKTVEDGSIKHETLKDLKAFTTYKLAIAGYTSVGEGVFSSAIEVQTLEDTPGKPQNLTFTSVSQTSARVLWDPPEDPNGEILGYKVSWYQAMTDGSKEVASHELQQNERTFKATNLKPDTPYVFTITAKTKQGWGQQNSQILYTYDSQLRANLPFFRESWFVILCASLSIVITIIITSLLWIQTKSHKYKQEAMKQSTSHDRLGDAGFVIDNEPSHSHYHNTGFGLLSQNANHRRSNGALSQSTANFTLPKSPPRPHLGSVVYSDDGDDDVFEDPVEKNSNPVKSMAGTSHYGSSGDSLTEKPSEISSSTGPESESNDDEYVNMANRHFVNHYANVNGTLRGRKIWKKQNKHYSTQRTKPKLPQRPAPTVPQVPGGEPGSSSSEANSSQPTPGTSGISSLRPGSSIYGETSHRKESPQMSLRTLTSQPGTSGPSGIDALDGIGMSGSQNQSQEKNTQHNDLLNSHIVNLNGGRITVDNVAGSRAPLPGFTSFV